MLIVILAANSQLKWLLIPLVAILYNIFEGIGSFKSSNAHEYKQTGTLDVRSEEAARLHAMHNLNQKPQDETDHQFKEWRDEKGHVIQTSTQKNGLRQFTEYWSEKNFDNPDK